MRLNHIGSMGNAFTGRDYTFYYHIMAKQYLALAFEIESQRMKNLSPSINEFNIEKKVIHEEMLTRIGKEPFLLVHNALYQYAFTNHAYQFPIIGRLEDLNKITLAQTMSWYNNHYTANNATIVVVGDVTAEEVFKLARKNFSDIKKLKKNTHKPANTQTEPAKNRLFVMPDKTKVGVLLLAYKVPSIKTAAPAWEAYALEVLAAWLETGRNSRLSGVLINDRQRANEMKILFSPMSRAGTLFIIEATAVQGVSLLQLKNSITEEIEQIKKQLINKNILQKIKNQMTAVEIFDRDSIYTQAKIIGQAESIGIHWSEDAQYISRIKSVTAEQVSSVLKKYLTPEREIVIMQNSYKSDQKD